MKYLPSEIEKKWQGVWEKEKIYSPNLDKPFDEAHGHGKPFYNLMMFPYPSAEGMHVGNMYTFTGADIYGRFKRMQGNDVFEPIGLDGFGIHSENYAIKVGRHPKEQAKISEKNFYRQLKATGNSYDWSRTVETYDPKYYKWTQWIFIQLFKAGLAYRNKAPVNFCPSCKTVLADEQVIDEKCERCSSIVEKKELEQWFFKITKYADRLLDGLSQIDWAEKIKIAQRQWIGRSEGMIINFGGIDVFTTRPETADGATFLVLSPQHPKAKEFKSKEVIDYMKISTNKSDEERRKEKTGVFTGKYIINPLTKKKIPVWIADYVLMGYGTGAIMAVPAEDERDREFAEKYKIPIEKTSLSAKPVGKKVVNYHLRDWLISRQRYWGPPIPMIFCEKCDWQPVPEKDLPVLLPDVSDWKPLGTASNVAGAIKSPLANHPEFYKTRCPKCKGEARRETDVSDTFLDSAWYFLRYIGTEFDKKPFDESRIKKWLPVNMYIGGAEHAVLHLLYSRFITMALHDLGFISFDEPFTKFYAHGLIIKDGAKMSKSKGNVVVPDAYIKKYGADALRCSLMFTGPFNMGGDFRDSGIEGMNRFLRRIWNLAQKSISNFQSPISNEGKRSMNQTIKKVTDDLENLRYNTAIASLMEYYNFLSSQKHIAIEEVRILLKLLAPLAPHITEELWQNLRGPVRSFPPASAPSTSSAMRAVGNPATSATPEFKSVHLEPWPKYDNKFLKEDRVTIAVQVNGKIRGTIEVQNSKIKNQKDVEHFAKLSANVKKHLIGKKIKKVIYVEGRIINFVIE